MEFFVASVDSYHVPHRQVALRLKFKSLKKSVKMETVNDSESILLTNILVSLTVKYFVSKEEMFLKNIVSGLSSGFIVECSHAVNGLKALKAWLRGHLNYPFRLCLKDRS